jgi:DNA-binding FrmR family transcriptional regulator
MIQDHSACVRDAIALLIAVRTALSDRANTVLLEAVDEAIQRLVASEREGHCDQWMIADVLKILGDGLALVPVIVELIQRLNL